MPGVIAKKAGERGEFATSVQLSFRDEHIAGTGMLSSIVRTKPGIVQYFPLFVASGTVKLTDTAFLGDPALPAGHDFCDFIDAEPTVLDCLFGDRQRDLVILSRVNRSHFERCHFRNWGGALPDNPGAGQYAGGMAINGWNAANDGTVVNCHFYDGAGGVWVPVTDTRASPAPNGIGWNVSGNSFRRLKEVAIVAGDRARIIGNDIADIAQVDVSGHAIEAHGDTLVITGNPIIHCDGAGIYAANLYNSIIAHNPISGTGRKVPCGAITLATFGPEAGEGDVPPHDVTIVDNQIPRDEYILLTNHTGDSTKLMRNITIRATCPVLFSPDRESVIGEGCDIEAPEQSSIDLDGAHLQRLAQSPRMKAANE